MKMFANASGSTLIVFYLIDSPLNQFYSISEYEGDFLDGQPHGEGIWYGSRGEIIEGEFRDGLANGHAVMKTKNGVKVCDKHLQSWMVYSLGVRARGLEYGGREFESRSLHLKPETKLCEERGLSGCRKGLKTVPLAQALLSLKPAKNKTKHFQSITRFQSVFVITG